MYKDRSVSTSKGTIVFNILTILISTAAIIISIYSNNLVIKTTKEIATSEFRAVEQVKSDTVKLISAFRSLILKGVWATQGVKNQQIEHELQIIREFMLGTTGLAYHSWVAHKSKVAGEKPEQWRTFYLQMSRLVATKNAYDAATIASKLEDLITKLDAQDFIKIASFLNDIPKLLEDLRVSRKEDVLIRAFIEHTLEKEIDPDIFQAFIAYLVSLKINDPDVETFYAVMENDRILLEKALKKGGNPNITDNEIIKRYDAEYKKFIQQRID